jgi:hypothetical protein
MRSKLNPIENFLVSHVVLVLRLAALVSIASGLVGGYVWLIDLADRDDGDSLRWGFWHNPFMQFPPFDEPFLDVSMWVLFACSAAAGLGGLMLLVPRKWGVPLVTWQARVSIATNAVTAFFIVAMTFVFADELMFLFENDPWDEWHLGGTSVALALRLGSVAVDLMLWTFLSSDAVREFFVRQSHPPQRAFEVILTEPRRPT